ncbi:MAG: hypothetical protein ACR2QO_23640 [Acidimicrobiales bacterium]
MKRIARLTLLAYPRTFRREFGADYLETVDDLRHHGHHSTARIIHRLFADALTTAPTMRWDNFMNTTKIGLATVVAVGAAFGVLIGAPIVAFPLIALLAVLVLAARRHDRPIAAEAMEWAGYWPRWLAAAAGLFLLGAAMLFTAEDGNLTTIAWATWILSWLAAAIVAVVGLGLGATRLVQHRRT